MGTPWRGRWAAGVMWVIACSCVPSAGGQAGADAGAGAADAGPSVQVGASTPVMPLDHPPVVDPLAGTASAGARRLSVAQLKASLPVVLRGHGWKVGNADGFDARSGTLGVPDYVSSVEENLEATPLYLKFMGDMARDACNRAVTADGAQPDAAQRAVLRFVEPVDTVARSPAKVDENLAYLRLSFLGRRGTGPADPALAQLRTLFDQAVQAAAAGSAPTRAHVLEGWRAVCVALLTSPEFHLY
jgi:hypothetical protein